MRRVIAVIFVALFTAVVKKMLLEATKIYCTFENILSEATKIRKYFYGDMADGNLDESLFGGFY